MFPPFDEALAFKYCKEIISLLEEKKLSLVYTTEKISAERFANGIMIGVLVAKNSAQENKIFFTVSGISRKIEGKFQDAIFVEPIELEHAWFVLILIHVINVKKDIH